MNAGDCTAQSKYSGNSRGPQRKTVNAELQTDPSCAGSTMATALRFGRTVETRMSPALTTLFARLGACSMSIMFKDLIALASASIAETSM